MVASTMTEKPGSGPSDRFDIRVGADVHFSWLRTRLAVETTLLAWIRTAVSMVGFGFAIVQFFDYFHQFPVVTNVHFPDAARYLGLALIFCGVVALVISVLEYRWTVRYLWSGSFASIAGTTKEGKQTPIYAAAIVLILIGTFAFFAVLLHLV